MNAFKRLARARPAASLLLLLLANTAFSQLPVISSGGIVSAASFAGPVTPGAIVSIFGTNLAPASQTASELPLPRSLGGTTVMLNSVIAPLFFVSPTQINLQVPTVFKTGSQASITVTTAAGVSNSIQVRMSAANPALFTIDGSGCGQAAALNLSLTGQVTVNSPGNSADPKNPVAIFGTGIDQVFFPPPDGEPSTGPTRFVAANSVEVDGQPAIYTYGGLAPSLVGVDQLNFQIPPSAREGCAVPLVVSGSPTTTLSIHTGGGQCVDPPVKSYGRIYLTRTIASGTGNGGETDVFTATFPSGPALRPPAADTLPPVGSLILNDSPVVAMPSRNCAVPGNRMLSAGTIKIVNPAGIVATVAGTVGPDGITYQQTLPNGFIVPGAYSFSSTGPGVSFAFSASLGNPVQVQSPQTGTVSQSQPFTVRWTGGDTSSIVKVSLVSAASPIVRAASGYAKASDGFFTFNPFCSGGSSGTLCSFQLPDGATQITVDVVPDPAFVPTFLAPPLTGTIQVRWDYKLLLGGVSLVP